MGGKDYILSFVFYISYHSIMRILFINDHYPPEGGGTAQVVKNLAGGFTKSGHEVLILTTHDGTTPQEIFIPDVGKVRFFPIRYLLRYRSYLSLWNQKTTFFLQNALKEFKPDVVLVHNIHSYFSYRALKILKQYDISVILTLHDVMTIAYGKVWPKEKKCDTSWRLSWLDNIKKARKQYNPFRSFFIRHYLKFPDRIFCVSDALRSVLAGNGIRTDGVIHNGINMADAICFESAIYAFIAKHHLEHKKIIVFGGRLTSAKGGRELIVALRYSLKRYNAVLVVVGDGPELIKLRATVEQNGMQGEVRFLGKVDNDVMHLLYSAAYCVAVPSISFDSFPTMNLEAMLHKKPIVATCFGGSKEAVEDGVTGYIVNPYDMPALGSAVEKLLSSPELARAMGEAGYLRLKKNFTVEEQIKRLLVVADEIKRNKNEPTK